MLYNHSIHFILPPEGCFLQKNNGVCFKMVHVDKQKLNQYHTPPVWNFF